MELQASKKSLTIFILIVAILFSMMAIVLYNARKAHAAMDRIINNNLVIQNCNVLLIKIDEGKAALSNISQLENLSQRQAYQKTLLASKIVAQEIVKLTSKDPVQSKMAIGIYTTVNNANNTFNETTATSKYVQSSTDARLKFINENMSMLKQASSQVTEVSTIAEASMAINGKANVWQLGNVNKFYLWAAVAFSLFALLVFFMVRDHFIKQHFASILGQEIMDKNTKLLSMSAAFPGRLAENEESRKKMNSEYSRSIIEASHDPLITISTDGKIMDVNNAMMLITEKSRQSLIDTAFESYFTDAKMAKLVYDKVFEVGFITDFPLTLKDGKLVDVLFNGSVFKDSNGKILGAVIVARDVTEQNKITAELNEAKLTAELAANGAVLAREKAEDAVRSKQQFLSNMSHEIRTPMNAIIGFTKVVLKTELSIHQREYLSAIKISGDALIVLLNDILDLAKVDAGKMVFETTPFNLFASVSAMLHLFESKTKEKNILLISNFDNQIPQVIEGDPVRLHQIIINLLSNAVKFTSEGQISLTISMLAQTEKDVTISFAVEDTGIGIAEDQLDSIFENFQQASSNTSRIFGGTGLGLAIVKQLVLGQNGEMAVSSILGKGSIFTATLTFSKTNKSALQDDGIFELDDRYKNIKVLVVEDILLNQLLMKTLLDDFGFECHIVSNGKLAVEILKVEKFDIVLMDLQMPEMNGFEATRFIRNELKLSIPIIALTADVTTTDVEECKKVGMEDYISKPVDEKQLYSKIISNVIRPDIFSSLNESKHPSDFEKKFIDLAYLTGRTMADPKLMSEIITAFLDQTPGLIAIVKQSVLDENWTLLSSAIHKMIPSFAVVGMDNDFEIIAKEIQLFATAQIKHEGISDLVIKLEDGCQKVCNELRAELHVLNSK